MNDNGNFQMAIDMLCCHLGLTEDEAREQLGLKSNNQLQQQITDTQQALMSLSAEK